MSSPYRSSATGAVVHQDYRDNFVVWPGREAALHQFVNQTYAGQQHKLRATRSSNSEDALTWSCFDTLNCLPAAHRQTALATLWSLAFPGTTPARGFVSGRIFIGKSYGEPGEQTEVDVSIEGDEVLVFVEAKLYSPMSLADEANRKPHDQIARKLRVGIKEAQRTQRAFYFLILDIAPKEILRGLNPGASLAEATTSRRGGFAGKWLTAYWFARYKGGSSVTPLRTVLKDIPIADATAVSRNMGWLVWSDIYKTILRSVIAASVDRNGLDVAPQ
ncbi:MAG: hypothetical protein M3R07_00555 [Gemmatimonadota bacterium]|nr:hypothetical protein [Gemmatimonadota bacterium]